MPEAARSRAGPHRPIHTGMGANRGVECDSKANPRSHRRVSSLARLPYIARTQHLPGRWPLPPQASVLVAARLQLRSGRTPSPLSDRFGDRESRASAILDERSAAKGSGPERARHRRAQRRHTSRDPWAWAPACAAVPTCGALARAGCQPRAARVARRTVGGLFDHNAFSRGRSVATIETVPSMTTAITAARTAIPARRVHRAIRVRAMTARRQGCGPPAARGDERPAPRRLAAPREPSSVRPRVARGSGTTAAGGFGDSNSQVTRLHHQEPEAQAAVPRVVRLSIPNRSSCPLSRVLQPMRAEPTSRSRVHHRSTNADRIRRNRRCGSPG